MATYPLATLAGQVTPTGFSAPPITDIVNSEIATEQAIFGSDIVLTPDSQDGQRLAIRCAAINDANQMGAALYNSVFPSRSQGVGLSALVQINGINRNIPTNSTAVCTIAGVVGTVIQGGVAVDTNGNLWDLPDEVTIPESGQITVTVTAQEAGAIAAIPGAINAPYTIINGWQTITNPAAAIPGAAVESDGALRSRRSKSTALAAQTPRSSILAAVANVAGVARYWLYENNGNATDGNGIPAGAISVVVEGGDVTAIATAIESKKAPGIGTYGSTSITGQDVKGVPWTINFFEVTEQPIYFSMTIQPLNGYVSSTGAAALAAVVAFINSLAIGQSVVYNWLLGIAGLTGTPLAQTFIVTGLVLGTEPEPLSAATIAIPFNAAASCSVANGELVVS